MKQIIFKAIMNGEGIVNFDDNSQKYTLNKLKIGDYSKTRNDNIKLCKKTFFKKKDSNGNFIKDEDGNNVYDYCVKISADCIRKAIFSNSVESVNPIILKKDLMACTYMLSPVGQCRGYLYTVKDDFAYKRKSPLTITDANEISGAKSELEINSTSGDRNATSMFYTEKVGKTEYEFFGVIDPKTLMFNVADPIFDRMGIHPDWVTNGLAEQVLHNLYGDMANPTIGYFTSSQKCLTSSISEFGIMLNKELVNYLIKYILINVMKCSIKRNTAFANVTSLSIKVVDNIFEDNFESPNGWIDINSEDDIKKLDFDIYNPYVLSTEEEVKEMESYKEEYNKKLSEMKDEKNRLKEEKAKNKKSKKNEEN